MRKTLILAGLIVLLLLAGCGRKNAEDLEAATMREERTEDIQEGSGEMPDASGEFSPEPPMEPSGEPSAASDAPAAPTAAPAPTPVPIVSGTYRGDDGSTLTIRDDGSVTYETLVSGTVNGVEMSKMLTFHGTAEGEGFVFTKVTFMQLDLTAIAEANGLVDGSAWQDAAWRLYLAQLG